MTDRLEPGMGSPIAVGRSEDHIRNMRRYNHRIAVFGSSVPTIVKFVGPTSYHAVTCKHFPITPDYAKAFLEGMKSISLFPGTTDVLKCIEPNGLMADWVNVGSDIKKSMGPLTPPSETADADVV